VKALTFDQINHAQHGYRAGITTLLDLGGIPEHTPVTEREWVLFDTNQHLRDMGLQKPLPWGADAVPMSETDLLDVLEKAQRKAR